MPEQVARKSRTRISSRRSARRSGTSKRPKRWRRFTLVVPTGDQEPATALLETATRARSASEPAGVRCGRDGAVAPLARITVHVPAQDASLASTRLARALATARTRRVLSNAELAVEDVRDEAWATSWKKHYTPIHIAPKLFIVPTWDRRFKAPRGSRVVRLDPGMAFGTGQHASTQLALNLMLPYVRRGSVVLDIGCGSGILALAAAGAGARVYASDTDPIAIDATRTNFKANKLTPERLARAQGVPASFPRADLIIANITAPILEQMAPAFARKLRAGGVLVTSGFIKSTAPRIRRVLEAQRLELLETGGRMQLDTRDRKAVVTGMWRAFVHRKRARKRS